MTALNQMMIALARGDSSVQIPHLGRTDELGEMAQAVEVFKRNMIDAEQIAAQQAASRKARAPAPGKTWSAIPGHLAPRLPASWRR